MIQDSKGTSRVSYVQDGWAHTQVDRVFGNGTVRLVTIDENRAPLFANGHRMRLYHNPISKDAFTSHIAADPEYQLEKGQEYFTVPINLQTITVIPTLNFVHK